MNRAIAMPILFAGLAQALLAVGAQPDSQNQALKERLAQALLAADAKPIERRWNLELSGFFHNGKDPLSIAARERDGRWFAAVGSSQKKYNGSFHYADMSKVSIAGGKVKGEVTLHVTPDIWIPFDHRGFTIVLDLDAAEKPGGGWAGSYQVKAVNTTDRSMAGHIRAGGGGSVSGTSMPDTPPPLPAQVTFNLNLHGALVGGKPGYPERCMVLQLGCDKNKLVSAVRGAMNQKPAVYGLTPFAAPDDAVTYDNDRIRGKLSVTTPTLDLVPAVYAFEFEGCLVGKRVVGAYQLKVSVQGDKPETVAIDGSFDGTWAEGAKQMKTDDRPWWTAVKGFVPPGPGEHPRLLFRKSDLEGLKKKAQTPEGRAILARLRRTLNGSDGETLPGQGGAKPADDSGAAGAVAKGLTIGHVAGYGLLYQLTGDKKYADLGREAFEKALAGTRDVDSRYSFRRPGGPLRAGPALGWHAVGFDLCYDGWDEATREKLGRAIAEYNEGEKAELESLVRGTMPPGSNHFGMQVGGAAMALLAVTGEKFVDQKRIDTLLAASEHSMMRNLTEGFGDGGFFAEGDGTGSMSSQIAFVSALQSWKNALGRDYINVERPNARMMTLKWIYLTRADGGSPQFWPIRGAYGHNVWARAGKSGAGYFAVGLGGVTEEQRAAMKWYYEHFLLEMDKAAGCPYDTASRDPNFTVCAFVNWPVDLKAKDPAEVLPLCYRDTIHGFVGWRNRWRDENDIIISVLLKPTAGYMGAAPDGGFQVSVGGRKFKWGQVSGETKYWWSSPRGEASVLTTASGASTAVDFTKASGADAMLVTTGKADGEVVELGGKALTFKFLNADKEPAVAVEGDKALVGRQVVSIKDGNLVLATTTAQ
ncbi:MAG: hypothetical protein ABR915_00580 [Thermoguttaceae bacterium]